MISLYSTWDNTLRNYGESTRRTAPKNFLHFAQTESYHEYTQKEDLQQTNLPRAALSSNCKRYFAVETSRILELVTVLTYVVRRLSF